MDPVLREEVSRGRVRLALCAGAAAALAAAGASAASAPNPKALVLQKADLPVGAVKGPSYTASPSTFGNREYWVTYNVRAAGREEVLTSEAAASAAAGRATAGYRVMLATETGLPGASALKLPSYGREQRAEYQPDPGLGVLVVHQGNVVWRLAVQDCGPQSPAGCLGGVTPPKLTRSQAVAELEKYARKQKARVGKG